MANSPSPMGPLWKPRKSSAATRSSRCATRKRRWRWPGSSCSSMSSTCRAGMGPAKCARSRPRVLRRRMTWAAIRPRAEIERIILATWRVEQPRLITSLSRMLRDVPLAEDLTQDALLAALAHWPATGVPDNPGAWLMTIARRRALDHLRHRQMITRKHGLIASDMEREQQQMPDPDAALDDE